MRKVRDGGYSALPSAVKDTVASLTGHPSRADKVSGQWLGFLAGVFVLFCIFFALFIIVLGANNFIGDAHNAHLADEHDATFSGRTTYWAMLPGMIAGTGLGIIIGYAAILFTPFHERIAAIWIMSAEKATDKNAQTNRDLNNYFLDRVDEEADHRFLKASLITVIRIVWKWVAPMLVLTAIIMFLDSRTYQYLAPSGLRSSNFLQIGQTYTGFHQITHIEAGCKRRVVKSKHSKRTYTDKRYEVFFDTGESIDLFQADQTGSRLYDIERYEYIFTTHFGKTITAVHDVGKSDTLLEDMPRLCERRIQRYTKPEHERRARALLRLPEPVASNQHAASQTN